MSRSHQYFVLLSRLWGSHPHTLTHSHPQTDRQTDTDIYTGNALYTNIHTMHYTTIYHRQIAQGLNRGGGVRQRDKHLHRSPHTASTTRQRIKCSPIGLSSYAAAVPAPPRRPSPTALHSPLLSLTCCRPTFLRPATSALACASRSLIPSLVYSLSRSLSLTRALSPSLSPSPSVFLLKPGRHNSPFLHFFFFISLYKPLSLCLHLTHTHTHKYAHTHRYTYRR